MSRVLFAAVVTMLVVALGVAPGRVAAGSAEPDPAIDQEVEFGYNEGWADRGFGRDRHIRPRERARLVRRTAEGGATTNRVPVRWNAVQPGNGLKTRCRKRPSEHPKERWGKVNSAYSQMLREGIRPLLTVGGAPCWAAQPRRARSPVTQCDRGVASFPPARQFYGQWQRFVRHVAERYPQALGIEVMNEPNLRLFWGGCPTRRDADKYGELLRRAYNGVKAEEPEMPVATAGMAPNDDPGGYLRKVFAYGKTHRGSDGELPWDAVGVHAYRSKADLAAGLDFADSAAHQLEIVREAETAAQVEGEQWVTEVGASTVSNRPRKARRDPVFARGPNKRVAQASALVDIYTRLVDEGVPIVIIHRLANAPRRNSGQPRRERGAGVLKARFRPKPAYFCLAALRGVAVDCDYEYG